MYTMKIHFVENYLQQEFHEKKPFAKMQLGAIFFLSLFVVNFSFADILPYNQKPVATVVVVQGLSSTGKTKDGSELVLVVDGVDGSILITKVLNNKPIDKGYKFNSARLYFVSANLLEQVGQDITAIDYTKPQAGLTEAPFTVPGVWYVDLSSPVISQTIIYELQ